MKNLINHFRRWNIWRKGCMNPWHYKLFVLFGIIESPTMYTTFLPEEWEEVKAKWLDDMRRINELIDAAILGSRDEQAP